MSRTFSTNSGSLESFQCSTRCGWSPNVREILEIAAWLSPVAAAIFLIDQSVQAAFDKPLAPLADHLRRHPLASRHRLVALTLRAGQHHPRPLRQRLRARRAPRPPLKRLALCLAEYQLRLRTSRACHRTRLPTSSPS